MVETTVANAASELGPRRITYDHLEGRVMGRLGIRAIPIVAVLALAVAAGCGSGSSSSGGGGGNAGTPVNISTCHAPVGKGQFTIVSDLPRQGSNKIQTDQMTEAIQMVLEQAHFKAGKYTVQYQDCDDSTAQAGQGRRRAARTPRPTAAIRA